ncbi:hypothetical protein Aglo01_41510 [Actinokineospora globicatena]|nr:hypothetical protein Aglo01_41510 [Actinokineospora globicatena]GLW85920.1 hypothetical protein Aglo02_35600 [Actinokineospora globicatena]
MEFRRRLERLHELDSGESRIQYQAYEIWVRDLLETAGADISTPTDKEERGFDLAAAVPSMPSYFGPLIVEVKVVTSSRSLFDAALRLGDRVAKENISLGLLLFDDAKVQVPLKIEAVPRVVYLGFRQLLDALRNNSLARVVMDTRNEAVHRP